MNRNESSEITLAKRNGRTRQVEETFEAADATANRMGRLLLRMSEAAEVLGVSRAFVYQMAAMGQIPTVTLGQRARRVPVAALTKWVEQQADSRQGANGNGH